MKMGILPQKSLAAHFQQSSPKTNVRGEDGSLEKKVPRKTLQ
jgi:hypothetical protein